MKALSPMRRVMRDGPRIVKCFYCYDLGIIHQTNGKDPKSCVCATQIPSFDFPCTNELLEEFRKLWTTN
jgi:hypothetical protein